MLYVESKDLEENPDITGEYNVPRAIATFNKRIDPLLVVFKDEVSEALIVDDPEDRGIFTTAQCELINGHPLGEGDQDDLEDVLTISEQEMSYWGKRGLEPFTFMKMRKKVGKIKLQDYQIFKPSEDRIYQLLVNKNKFNTSTFFN